MTNPKQAFFSMVLCFLIIGILPGCGGGGNIVGVSLQAADMAVDAGRVYANKAAAESALAQIEFTDDEKSVLTAFIDKKEAVKDFLKSLAKPGTYTNKDGRDALRDDLKEAFASHVEDLAQKGRAAYDMVKGKIDSGSNLDVAQVNALAQVWEGYKGLHGSMKQMAASADVYRNYVNAVTTLLGSFPMPGR